MGKPSKPETIFFPTRFKIKSWIENHESNLIFSLNSSFLDITIKKNRLNQ